jgi:hypothetical protein
MKIPLCLVILLLVCLTSCFPVEDFGSYWNRAGIDARLSGVWRRPDAAQGFIKFVQKNGAYEIQRDGKAEQPGYPIKTLNVGNYQFLLAGPKKGFLLRYKLEAGQLRLCWPLGANVAEFIAAKHPHPRNISLDAGPGPHVSITVFDDEVFDTLAHVPDTEAYWACDSLAKLNR